METMEDQTQTTLGTCQARNAKGMADKVSGWGDHYQFVALKSGIQYYITKEILRIRGLISIYDYYIERHALKVN